MITTVKKGRNYSYIRNSISAMFRKWNTMNNSVPFLWQLLFVSITTQVIYETWSYIQRPAITCNIGSSIICRSRWILAKQISYLTNHQRTNTKCMLGFMQTIEPKFKLNFIVFVEPRNKRLPECSRFEIVLDNLDAQSYTLINYVRKYNESSVRS